MSTRIMAVLTLTLLACESAPAGPAADPAVTLAVVSGDAQTSAPGTELPAPIVAVVLDHKDKPVRGQLVNFVVTAGGGSVFAGSALSDADGMVREWWTLGPEPGENVLEARAVEAETGAKLVFATFHATAETPTPADPLEGTWTGTRQDGITVTYVFTNTGGTAVNSRTGNTAQVYEGVFSAPELNTQTFAAYFEPPYLYWGAVSQGELTGQNTLVIWSDFVEPFTTTRADGQ